MPLYYIVDSTGEPRRSLMLSREGLLADSLTADEGAVTAEPPARFTDCWWDSAHDEWRQRPPAPSEHHAWSPTVKAWYDPRTLDDIKASKWAEIKEAREEAKVAPTIDTPFGVLDADAVAVQNVERTLAGLREATALGIAPTTITWTLADNTDVSLTPTQLAHIAVLLLNRGNAAHERARYLRTLIDQATTVDEVSQISWTTPQ